MVGPVPMGSTLAVEKASKMSEPGYIELSGTSFSAPVISGIAAQILARNPDMTPDQVKGAIMRRARPVPMAENRSCGVGQVNAVRAVYNATTSSNPNRALDQFLKVDPATGQTVFDAVSWSDVSRATSPGTRSRGAMSPGATSPGTRSRGATSPGADVSWSDVSWSDVSWEDAAGDQGTPDGSGVPLTPEQEAAAAVDPDLAPLPGPGVPVLPTVADATAGATEAVTSTAAEPPVVSAPALPLP